MLERPAAVFLADAGLLEAAERHLDGGDVVVVDPHNARFQRVSHAVGPVDVPGEHAAGQAEGGVVGPRQHFLLIAETEQRHHRPEDLLADEGHIVVQVVEHRGRHEVAVLEAGHPGPLAADQHAAAFLLALFNVVEHMPHMPLADQRTHVGLRVERIAQYHLAGARQQFFHEGVLHRFVHEHPGAVGAHLALGVEITQQRAGHGVIQVGVLEHDQRRLAAQFQGHRFQGIGGGTHHRLAGAHLAGERDLVDARVRGQRLAGFREALHHVEHAVRQAGFLEHFRQTQRRQRREFGGFEDHRVAGGQRRRRLPGGDLQRVVPGADAGAHAQGFRAGVEKAAVHLLVFALQGRRLAGEILETVGGGIHVRFRCLRDRLAGVQGFQARQIIALFAQQLGGAHQHPAPGGAVHGAPLRQAVTGGPDRPVHVLGAGHRHPADHVAGGRIQVIEKLAVGALLVMSADP